jgi:hypothetical protein
MRRLFVSLVLLLALSCAGAGTRRVLYDKSHEQLRAASYSPTQVQKLIIFPPVVIETENLEGLGDGMDWAALAQSNLLAACTAEKQQAMLGGEVAADYREVAEGWLQRSLGEEEKALLAAEPEAAKIYQVFRDKTQALPPREWARKWREFVQNFSSSPFAALAKKREALLAALPPHVTAAGLEAAKSQGASHVLVPVLLRWVRSTTYIGGVPREVYSAELSIELIELSTFRVVWLGYGVQKEDEQAKEPLKLSLEKAARHVVEAFR